MDCIFCKIVNGDIPSKKLYEDDSILAFYDVEPKAPVHFLVIPKEHIKNAVDIPENKIDIISHIFKVIKNLAIELNLKDGFRVVNNCGEQGGQTVNHLHFHVLSGRNLNWPPG